jgi:putative RecB family exonuclease
MPRKPTLSPTRIATYLECAVKYRYIYHDKIGRFYLRARAGYSFGSTMHQVLQTFHEEVRATGEAQSVERMMEEVETRWISAGYESTEQEQEYRSAGSEVISSYHAAVTERLSQGVETLWTEKTIATDMGPFRLSGRVDRVDRHADGALEIIDYKSGRWEVTPEDVAESLAMNIYQFILRRNHPGVRVLSTIYALRSGQHASAEMTDDEAGRFGADILALGEEILGRDYENLEPAHVPACPTCEFLPKCEAFWRMRKRMERLD